VIPGIYDAVAPRETDARRAGSLAADPLGKRSQSDVALSTLPDRLFSFVFVWAHGHQGVI